MHTPRHVFKDTLEFNRPQRVPRDLWTLPWAEDHYPEMIQRLRREYPPDIVTAPGFYHQELPVTGSPYKRGIFVDPWGCVFENIQDGIIGEVKKPIVNDWGQLDEVHVPREKLSIDRDCINNFCRQTDRFVKAGQLARPFEQLQFMRGTERLYMDLIDMPEGLCRMIDMMHRFYLDEMTAWAETEVDALMIMDDWGSQDSMLISPDMWRRLFKPLYREYVEVAHAQGKYLLMHSDGHIIDIYPDLIEIGVDAVNSQIFCMGVDQLAAFAGKITFWGEIDRQRMLPHGTTDEVGHAVDRVFDTLYRDGGVIAQCEFGPGADPDNVLTVFRRWEERAADIPSL